MIVWGAGLLAAIVGWSLLAAQDRNEPGEQSVMDIPLSGPIAKSKAELSGLAWAGETLILLPQYPEKFGPGDGAVFAIPKQEILDRLDGKSDEPIAPFTITLEAPGLKENIQDYEGFESIAVWNDKVYLTVESGRGGNMMGYLVSGTVSTGAKKIILDTTHVVKIEPAIQMDNRTDEAIVALKDHIFTFFEVNGAVLNPQPQAHLFNADLTAAGAIPFPRLEYRVTDAAAGTDGGIWALNTVSPKDSELIAATDPLLEFYGLPAPAAIVDRVERLVKLNLSDSGFELAGDPPIQLALGKDRRNWEGLALLDERGFLLVTDKHPDTILAFVPLP